MKRVLNNVQKGVSGFYDVIMDENWDEEVKFKCVEMK
jgi:hypothetical protein